MSLIPNGRRKEKVSLTEVANQNLVDAETQWFLGELAINAAASNPTEFALRW
ncbi:MAG TPA: hypothetical protein VLK84_21020 [Longimicrobium sp.]|nr:hypothetical protein [Longimicrobium sp.]